MLTITVPSTELFDESTETFIMTKPATITLEHSLISLSKWEAKWKRPFLKEHDRKTPVEILDYIKCMTITPNVSDSVYMAISANSELCEQIQEYINDPMTATTFNTIEKPAKSRQVVTSELIYYWMIQLNIPVEFQKWHLSRLLTLIKVCEIKNAAATSRKKTSKSAIRNRNRALNAQRRARLGTSG